MITRDTEFTYGKTHLTAEELVQTRTYRVICQRGREVPNPDYDADDVAKIIATCEKHKTEYPDNLPTPTLWRPAVGVAALQFPGNAPVVCERDTMGGHDTKVGVVYHNPDRPDPDKPKVTIDDIVELIRDDARLCQHPDLKKRLFQAWDIHLQDPENHPVRTVVAQVAAGYNGLTFTVPNRNRVVRIKAGQLVTIDATQLQLDLLESRNGEAIIFARARILHPLDTPWETWRELVDGGSGLTWDQYAEANGIDAIDANAYAKARPTPVE